LYQEAESLLDVANQEGGLIGSQLPHRPTGCSRCDGRHRTRSCIAIIVAVERSGGAIDFSGGLIVNELGARHSEHRRGSGEGAAAAACGGKSQKRGRNDI
jgi:hypothetical protein